MAIAMVIGFVGRTPVRLREVPGASWVALEVWDAQARTFRPLGGEATASPLIARGPAPLAAEIVVLPGTPPDPVISGGDYVWLRRMAPQFVLDSTGDLVVAEEE